MISDTLIDAFYKILETIQNFIVTYLPKLIVSVIIVIVASYLHRRESVWYTAPCAGARQTPVSRPCWPT